MQQLRELVLQLRADNERLRQERAGSLDGASGGGSGSSSPAGQAQSVGGVAVVTERLVVMPRDRKCPVFNGRAGIGITEWVEEVQACICARHLSPADEAFFILDHLEGEAKAEIKFRPDAEQRDPARVFSILQELYGCAQPYVTLQQAFFSRHQLEGETVHEFSLALMALMAQVRRAAPEGALDTDLLLRDQFMEHVLDGSLRRELKQFVRRQPTATLLELRGEAIRWEREGLPGGARGRSRSSSVPAGHGFQCEVQGRPPPMPAVSPPGPGFSELMSLVKRQQEQLDRLACTVAALQAPRPQGGTLRMGPVICRRCLGTGHFARECDGERAPPLPHRGNAVASSGPNTAVSFPSAHRSEN